MDWIEIGKSFGLPALILAGGAWFGFKALWPFIKGQVETAQREGRDERKAFLEALERRDREFGAVVNTLQEINKAIAELRNEIKARPTVPRNKGA